ncbi:MAG: hypothetical protein ABIP55_07635, partial [Tepidisphaeraceae bacterium]
MPAEESKSTITSAKFVAEWILSGESLGKSNLNSLLPGLTSELPDVEIVEIIRLFQPLIRAISPAEWVEFIINSRMPEDGLSCMEKEELESNRSTIQMPWSDPFDDDKWESYLDQKMDRSILVRSHEHCVGADHETIERIIAPIGLQNRDTKTFPTILGE